LWNAEIFECEPYDATLRVRQCFKYYKYGHIARYCRKTAKCGYCAAAAHEQEGENACSNGQASGIKKYVNCRNNHTAWDQACPTYKAASEKAKEAYAHRPRQFAIANTIASITETNQGRMFPLFIMQLGSNEGYTTISRKKGRPLRRGSIIIRSQFRAASSQFIQDYMRLSILYAAITPFFFI
jgi:hypothetical protein